MYPYLVFNTSVNKFLFEFFNPLNIYSKLMEIITSKNSPHWITLSLFLSTWDSISLTYSSVTSLFPKSKRTYLNSKAFIVPFLSRSYSLKACYISILKLDNLNNTSQFWRSEILFHFETHFIFLFCWFYHLLYLR